MLLFNFDLCLCIMELLLLVLLIHWKTSTATDTCFRKVFYPRHGHRQMEGTVLFEYTRRSVRVTECQRLCRQYLMCIGYNVHWVDVSQSAGTCHLVDASGYRPTTEQDENYSFYSVCPVGMSYYHETRSCYSYVETTLTWDAARGHCRTIYSGAHLIDVTSAAEQEIMQGIAVTEPGPAVECTKEYQGRDYKGTRNTTVSGLTCQRWDSQTPQDHNRNDPAKFPLAVYNVDNHCRNIDGEKSPWCYTTSPGKRWQYCGIPKCQDGGNTWLDGRRETTGSGQSFTWIDSGASVEAGYQNWHTAPADTTKQCIAAFDLTTNYGWFETYCNINIPFICEYEV